jgi:hypothetical protein
MCSVEILDFHPPSFDELYEDLLQLGKTVGDCQIPNERLESRPDFVTGGNRHMER